MDLPNLVKSIDVDYWVDASCIQVSHDGKTLSAHLWGPAKSFTKPRSFLPEEPQQQLHMPQ